MKLRNKKTNDVDDVLISAYGISGDVAVSIMDPNKECGYLDLGRYKTLAKLNEEWEDYVPKEPLIKDEKIRKAVRAWWKTIPDAVTDKRVLYKNNHDFAVGIYTIYCGAIYPETLEVGKMYTITELCGEEEE